MNKMKIKITLTDNKIIEVEQIKNLDNIKVVKDTIDSVLNNDCKFIRFYGEGFNRDITINKTMIKSMEYIEVRNENN